MSSRTASRDTAEFVNRDELLLERLSGVLDQIDPVPQGVVAAARAAFGNASQPRRWGGAVGKPDVSGFVELFGPPRELDLLTDRTAADVPGVAARARCGGTVNRLREVPARATKADFHRA